MDFNIIHNKCLLNLTFGDSVSASRWRGCHVFDTYSALHDYHYKYRYTMSPSRKHDHGQFRQTCSNIFVAVINTWANVPTVLIRAIELPQ